VTPAPARGLLAVGVVGTAKNTGKTTTLAAISRVLVERETPFVLTGIGYDGEPVDNLTSLPKPRYVLPRGCLVVTAERCVPAGSATLRRLAGLKVRTALGGLQLARLETDGSVLIAGPSSAKGLAAVMSEVRRRGVEVLLVDGSFGRLAPMAEVSALVLCTGAARTTDLHSLAAEVRDLEGLFTLPRCRLDIPDQSTASFWRSTDAGPEPVAESGTGENLIVADHVRSIVADAAAVEGWDTLFIPGAVHPALLEELSVELRRAGIHIARIVLSDPTKILSCSDAGEAAASVARLAASGQEVLLRRPMRLAFVAVNPFFPRRAKGSIYDACYVDAGLLRSTVADAVGVPVLDVLAEPDRLRAIVTHALGL